MSDKRLYAMKIIRAVERYIDSAEMEVNMLEHMRENDPNDKHHIVKLVEAFKFGDNYCIVFEKLGDSLYDFM